MKRISLAILLTAIISLGFLSACMPVEEEDISGYYRFEGYVYSNGLSSVFVTKDNAPDYVITDTSLIILNKDGTYKRITADFEKTKVDPEAFAALFLLDVGVPDISGYKQRYRYSIDRQYCLFVMDGEVWLAGPSSDIWFIYRLAKAGTNTADTIPEDVASQYLTFLKNGQCHEAYNLTTETFHADITEEFYCNYDFIKMLSGSLVGFEIGEAKIDGYRADVPVSMKITVTGEEKPLEVTQDLSLVIEDDTWRIDLSGYDFLAYNLRLQPPLAASANNDVSVTLKFIIISEKAKSDDLSYTHVHLDIRNNSGESLRWVLPDRAAEACYIEDSATGHRYLFANARDYKMDGNSRYADSADIGFVFLNPQNESSIVLNFDYVPGTVDRFNLVLSGFRFSDTGEVWNITFRDVAFVYDTVSE